MSAPSSWHFLPLLFVLHANGYSVLAQIQGFKAQSLRHLATQITTPGGKKVRLVQCITTCNCLSPGIIIPNFRGAKFSRIGLLKHFAEINFADQRFLMAVPNISRSLIFAVREESVKTAKIWRYTVITLLEVTNVTYCIVSLPPHTHRAVSRNC